MRNILLGFILFVSCGFATYQAIRHDNTLTGEGITSSPLKVDTSVIATPFDIISATRGSEISPAQITADQDNYNPSGWDDATVVRLDGDSGIRGVTSLTAPTTSLKPQEKVLMNIGSYPIYFPGEHPDGTAANRIAASQDIILYPKQSVRIVYDATSARWRIFNSEGYTRPTVYYSWSAGSITAGDHGAWASAAGGSGAIAATASTTTLPAAASIQMANAILSFCAVYFSKTVVSYSAFASSHQFIEAVISTPTLSGATNTYTVEVQLCPSGSSSTLEQNNSIAVRYSHGINSGKFELFTQDNAGAESTPVDLGVTVSANTLYKIRIETDKANAEARVYINNAYVGRVTTNMPNGVVNGGRVIAQRSAGDPPDVNIYSMTAGAIYP